MRMGRSLLLAGMVTLVGCAEYFVKEQDVSWSKRYWGGYRFGEVYRVRQPFGDAVGTIEVGTRIEVVRFVRTSGIAVVGGIDVLGRIQDGPLRTKQVNLYRASVSKWNQDLKLSLYYPNSDFLELVQPTPSDPALHGRSSGGRLDP